MRSIRIVALELKAYFMIIMSTSVIACLIVQIAGSHHPEYSIQEQLMWTLGGLEQDYEIPSISLTQISRWLLVIAPPLCLSDILIYEHRNRFVSIMLRIHSYKLLWLKLCMVIIAVAMLYSVILVGGIVIGGILTTSHNSGIYDGMKTGFRLSAVLCTHIAWLGFVLLISEGLFDTRGIATSIILLIEGGTAVLSQISAIGSWFPGTWGMLCSFNIPGNGMRNLSVILLQFGMMIAVMASTKWARQLSK